MKTISIRDDVYKKLAEMKDERESFSDVIEKLLKRKNTNIKKYFGVLKDGEVLDEIERCLAEVKILPFDVKAAEESSNIAARLMAMGREVNALDILIAGIAIADGADKIITRDKDFEEMAKVSDVEIVLYG